MLLNQSTTPSVSFQDVLDARECVIAVLENARIVLGVRKHARPRWCCWCLLLRHLSLPLAGSTCAVGSRVGGVWGSVGGCVACAPFASVAGCVGYPI